MNALQVTPFGKSEIVAEAAGPLARTVAICGRLADAAKASLIALDGGAIVAGDLAMPVDGIALRTAIEREGALMFRSADPRWTPDDGEGLGCTMLVRVGNTHLLALWFGEASSLTRARVERLVPELVALIAAQVDAARRAAELEQRHLACKAALDDGNCGIIAVRDDHTILFVNAAGEAMLAAGAGLQLKRGMLRPTDYRQAARFEAALDAVQDETVTSRGGKAHGLVMLVPGEQGARPLLIAVVPVHAGEHAVHGASALVYIIKPEANAARGLDTVAELHGLSGVERRLLVQLCAGLTVAESAVRMRIKLETGRAYLKQIFVKTGTHRQSELLTLMSRYLRAVRGDFDFKAG